MLKESRSYLEAALRMLGHPMPIGKTALILSLLRHVARQLRHRVRMPRLVQDEAKREQLLEGTRIYEKLAELYFFDNATAPTIYCTIRAANLAERAGPSPEMARTYANLCVATALIPQRKLADSYARHAKQIAAQVQDSPTEARILSRIGLVETGNARWQAALASLEKSIEIADELGDMRQRGEALAILANVHYLMGNFERSKANCLDLLESGRRRGDVQHQSWGYFWGAQAMIRLNEMDEADASLANGLELVDELLGDSVAQIINYGLLATARLQAGRMDDAREAADYTASLIAKVPAPTSFSQFEGYAGATAVYLTRWQATEGADPDIRSTTEALVSAMHRLCKRFPVGSSRAWNYQGVLEHLKGDADKAQQAWHQSLQEAIINQMPYEEGLAHYQLGRHLPGNDPQRTVHLDRAIERFTELKAHYNLAQAELAVQLKS
jgi:tetratricopeptide (TPR) repeat protein